MVKFVDSWTLLSSLATSIVRGNCVLPCKAISALKDAINVIKLILGPIGIWIGSVGPKILDLTGILGDD